MSTMLIVSHHNIRAKLRRLEIKTGVKVWRWSLHHERRDNPFIRVYFSNDGLNISDPLDLYMPDFLKYEDEEYVNFGPYRDPLELGAEEEHAEEAGSKD